MSFKIIIEIATSLMYARMKQTMVAAVGVTFGIAMFVALLGFMTGLNDLLDGLVINRTPHIRLYNEIKPSEVQPIQKHKEYQDDYNIIRSVKPQNKKPKIHNNGAIINALEKDNRVLGIAPKITAQVFYNVGEIELTGVINGIDPVAENNLFYFSDYVIEGDYVDLNNIPNSIIMGKSAADKMLAKIGDVIQVTTVKGERMLLKVVGYFQSGLEEMDKTNSYCSVSTTQKLMGESNNYITDIQIKLNNLEMAPPMAKEYSELFGVEAEDIQSANAQYETGTDVRNIISYAVGITLLIVAGFGIYNILNMMIYEKMDSIAILKATGFSGKDVNRIFITIAMTIGFIGGILGLFFGFLLSYGIDQVPFETDALPTLKTFPVNYSAKFYIIGVTFAMATTYLAGLLPARKASNVDPVVIIRGK